MNCKKITELVSLSCEQKLRLKQQLLLKIHLMMCPKCRGFARNCQTLERLVKQTDREDGGK